jgi:hypothetical protein
MPGRIDAREGSILRPFFSPPPTHELALRLLFGAVPNPIVSTTSKGESR